MWKRAAISDTGMSADFGHSSDGRDLFGGELRRTVSGTAAGASGFKACASPFARIKLRSLGQSREDVKDRPTCCFLVKDTKPVSVSSSEAVIRTTSEEQIVVTLNG